MIKPPIDIFLCKPISNSLKQITIEICYTLELSILTLIFISWCQKFCLAVFTALTYSRKEEKKLTKSKEKKCIQFRSLKNYIHLITESYTLCTECFCHNETIINYVLQQKKRFVINFLTDNLFLCDIFMWLKSF